MLTYILFVLGFVFLVKGADLLVDGASALAKRLKISDLAIGLTVVAFGTSLPELVVNLFASFSGNTEIAIGNIIGSNIANILLILGISAAIYPLAVKSNTVWKEVPFSLLAVLVFAFLANDRLIDGALQSSLTRSEGLVLIGFFIIFLYYIFEIARIGPEPSAQDNLRKHGAGRSLALIVAGLAGLVLGGKWVIDGAVALATSFGLSESLIGLTVVAVGTSLPELATSAVAAFKRNSDIAVGNIVGSNIFNIFWILGISAVVRPLPFSHSSNFDIAAVLISSLLLFVFFFIGKKHELERWQGAGFVFIYIVYLGFLIWRG